MKKILVVLFVALLIGGFSPSLQYNVAGAVYFPYQGTAPHYKLLPPNVITGDVNDRIRVLVFDQNGRPAFGVHVINAFGSGCPNECEDFVFTGEAVQFNLGGGSKYRQPDDPPNRVYIRDVPSDAIHVGNCDCIGWAHTDWQLTFVYDNGIVPPTITPVPITPIPGGKCDTTFYPISRVTIIVCAP